MFQVAGAEYGQDGAENFLAGDTHIRVDVGKDGGFDVPAGVVDAAGQGASAVGQGGAFGDANSDVFGNGALLGCAGQGADINAVVHAVADGELGGAGDKAFHKLVVDTILDDDAAGGSAALAGRTESTLDDAAEGFVQIGVGEEDDGVFAAHFGLHFFEPGGAAGVKVSANFGAAGEGYAGDIGGFHQGAADAAAGAGNQVEDAVGDAGFGKDFGQFDGGQRGDGRRLEYDGVAADEGGGHFPGGDGNGKVPGGNDADHAQGPADGVGDGVGEFGGGGVAEHPAALAGGVFNDIHRAADFATGIGQGFAFLLGDGAGDFVGAAFHDVQGAKEYLGAGRGGGVGPAGGGVGSGGDGAEGILRVGELEMAEELVFVGRVIDGVGAAGVGRRPLAVDVVVMDGGGGGVGVGVGSGGSGSHRVDAPDDGDGVRGQNTTGGG